MPPAVDRIARSYLRKPVTVIIGTAGQAVDTVEQRVEFHQTEDKKKSAILHNSLWPLMKNFRQRLLDILNNEGHQPPMIVFVNQKKTADQIAKDLGRAGVSLKPSLISWHWSDLLPVGLRCLAFG